MRAFAPLLGALLVAAPATAQEGRPTVSLQPGDAATVRLGPRGGEGSVERNAARWTAYDLAVARHMVGQPIPEAPVETAQALPAENMPAPTPIAPNQIRLRFHAVADRHTVLVIENGYDRAIVYRARMRREGRDQATDVCLVMPGRRSFEHWPHMMDRLDLSDFRVEEWQQGSAVPCR